MFLSESWLAFVINDLPLYLNYCLANLYTDGKTIHASGKSKPEIEHKLQSDAKKQSTGV